MAPPRQADVDSDRREQQKVEGIRSELLNGDHWALAHCGGQQLANPFNISPRTVTCERNFEIFEVSRALEHVRHDLCTLFDVLSTAAVLFGGMFRQRDASS